ncbi:transposase [Nocardia sp. NRRL S-836]|uniref:transposase n=1 Tax=Nocardia sp. NRRL S-836 TaxID=1519492 RepID=UPI0012FBE327|nr:transposase [Nocardia sp. NRRL S-836]
MIVKDDSLGALEDHIAFVVSIDSTSIRAPPTRHRCPEKGLRGLDRRPRHRRRMPRTLPLRTDHQAPPGRQRRRPAARGDPHPRAAGGNPQPLPLLDDICDIDVDGQRVRVGRVIADKAYAHPCTRIGLRQRRIKATISERVDQIARRKIKGLAGGRPPAFDPDIYKLRNVAERCFNRLKQFRGLATRFAKRAAYHRAEIILACIVLHLR